MLKKTLSVFLILCLLLTLSLSAFAETGTSTQPPEPPAGGGMPSGGQSFSGEYSSAVVATEDISMTGENFPSEGTDENALRIDSGHIILKDITVTRVSDSSTGGDASSFYGVGAAILAIGGETEIIGANITTNANGGAGVFSYGDAVVRVSDAVITTEKSTSGGVHVAGGGTLYADNVTATTAGASSAAIRSDRGGGLLVVNGGSFTSNGSGSPAIYSTANIAVKDAALASTASEAICIEGKNGIYLYDCALSGNMPENEQNDCVWNVILYQSMSGDSEAGNSVFQMSGGTLTAEKGGMFYTTNTQSTFILKNVALSYSDTADFLLRCTGNENARGWGTSGQNGADCTFTAIEQQLEGTVIYDACSKLALYLTEGSEWKGAFVKEQTYTGEGTATLYISADSAWIVTGDCAVDAVYNAGRIVDTEGNTVTVKDTEGNVLVSGNSALTVTVGSFEAAADLSGASALTSFEDAQVKSVNATDSFMPSGDGMGNPPEMPSGGMGTPPSGGTMGNPPEMPSGGMGTPPSGGTMGNPPEMPSGNMGTPPSGGFSADGTPPPKPGN